jgi:hypothetical protein
MVTTSHRFTFESDRPFHRPRAGDGSAPSTWAEAGIAAAPRRPAAARAINSARVVVLGFEERE